MPFIILQTTGFPRFALRCSFFSRNFHHPQGYPFTLTQYLHTRRSDDLIFSSSLSLSFTMMLLNNGDSGVLLKYSMVVSCLMLSTMTQASKYLYSSDITRSSLIVSLTSCSNLLWTRCQRTFPSSYTHTYSSRTCSIHFPNAPCTLIPGLNS